MKKPETKFKEKVLKQLKKIPKSWFFKTQMLSFIGIPDIIGVISGTFVAMELKKDEKAKIAPIQIYVLDQIKSAGGVAEIVSPENFESIFSKLLKISQ